MVASSAGGFTSVLTEVQLTGDAVDLVQQDARQLQIEGGSECVLMPLKSTH
jgi:hypothetical protein